jgi:diaminopimelate epimerase
MIGSTPIATLPFSKYSGCGNDFILIDHRTPFFSTDDPFLIRRLCHRQKGIGADGLILLENSMLSHFKMRIFNSDGSQAEMCGNGLRCLAQFLQELHLPKKRYTIEVTKQTLEVDYIEGNIRTSMGNPERIQLNLALELDGKQITCHFLDTGVPHAVILMDDIAHISIDALGSKIRHHATFNPKGTNVNFVQKLSSQEIAVRTYERGVEAETLACGTGAAAAAIAATLQWKLELPVTVRTRSNETLTIHFQYDEEGTVSHVTQIGPATKHFHGTFEL